MLQFNTDFPPNARWSRPSSDVVFIDAEINLTDIAQGSLNNCWFLSVLTLVSKDWSLFSNIIHPSQSYTNNPNGIFKFTFYSNREAHTIFVNDMLPKNKFTNELIFCKSRTNPKEYWSALLEKAYAMFLNKIEQKNIGYEILYKPRLLSTSLEHFGLTDFTHDIMDQNVKFNNNNCTYLFATGSHVGEGLVPLHAYTCLSIVDNVWFKLKNPYSDSTEFKGQLLNGCCLVCGDEHASVEDDGIFWINKIDLLKNFKQVVEIINTPNVDNSLYLTRVSLSSPVPVGDLFSLVVRLKNRNKKRIDVTCILIINSGNNRSGSVRTITLVNDECLDKQTNLLRIERKGPLNSLMLIITGDDIFSINYHTSHAVSSGA